MKLVISVSSSLGTGRPLLRCHLCMALRSCDANVFMSGSTLDFPENSRHGMSGATLLSSMAICPSCRLFGNFSRSCMQVHASGWSGCHRRCASLQLCMMSFIRKHRPCGGYEERGDMVLVLADCLFEESPQICGVTGCISGCAKMGLLGFGGWRRLFRRTTFKAFCAACLWTLDRFPAIRRSPSMPVVLVLLRSRDRMPSNLPFVLELRSHRSDQVPTCDVKMWQLWMSCIRGGSLLHMSFAQMLLNPVALLCPCLCMKRSDQRMWGAMCG